jgi:hypothetical protein
MRRPVALTTLLWAFHLSVNAAVLVSWNFNSTSPDNDPATGVTLPATGDGEIKFIGGSTNLLGEVGGGSPSDPEENDDTQLRITRPPAQGTNNKAAGIQIQFSSRGFENLRLSWAQYNSATASRYWRVMFGTDAVNWTEHAVITQTNSGAWLQHSVIFQELAALNDADTVFIRIVSEFESTATASGVDEYRAVRDDSNYSTAGSWWIDSLTVSGRAVGVSNQPPAISQLTDITLIQGKRSEVISFTISDAETVVENLSLSAEVSPSSSLTNLVLSGTGSDRTIRFYGSIIGEALVTIRLEDEEWNITETKFKVNIIPEPVEPTLGPVFVYWNFNSAEADGSTDTGATIPIDGAGELRAIGVTSQTFGSVGQGRTSDTEEIDNSMLRLSGFPPQGTADKSAGIEIVASTVGLRRIGLMWDQYNSATASRHLAVQYTTNGVHFVDHAFISNTSSSTWIRARKVSFDNIPGVENNPNFGVRLVSTFGPTGSYEAVGSSSSYGTTGTLWLDMVAITGEPVITNSSPVLRCTLIAGELILSWTGDLLDFVPELSTDLDVGWSDFDQLPEQIDGSWQLRSPIEKNHQFFRLRK